MHFVLGYGHENSHSQSSLNCTSMHHEIQEYRKESNPSPQQQSSTVSSTGDHFKTEPTFSYPKNIPLPDCPTPGSDYSCSEAFANISVSSPALSTEYKGCTNYTSNSSAEYTLTDPSCKAMNETSKEYSSPLFENIIYNKMSNNRSGDATSYKNTTSFSYAEENFGNHEYLKPVSSKLKGKC